MPPTPRPLANPKNEVRGSASNQPLQDALSKSEFSPEFVQQIRVLMTAELARQREAAEREQTVIERQNRKNRVQICITNCDSAELIPRILAVMTKLPFWYQQHGGIILRHRDRGKGPIEVVGKEALKTAIVEEIEFVKYRGEDLVKAKLDADVVNGILYGDRHQPEFRPFRRQAYAPYFAKDGKLVTKASCEADGYHADSRTVLMLPSELETMEPIKEKPTPAHVAEAGKFLTQDLLGDFPFFPLEASRSHMLAMLIAPFVRDIIGGLVPQLGIAAPAHGSGKTLLAKIIGLVTTGKEQAAMSAVADTDEQRKIITAVLHEGQPIAVFDNVKQGDIVGGSPLAALLSSNMWEARILGQSKMISLPNSCLWIITGNNLQFTGELARRTLVVQLRPNGDVPPHLRDAQTFRHYPDDLETWITKKRVQIIRAILTLVQNWVASGQIPFTARSLPTFERFAQVVGGILQAAQLEQGFLTRTRDIGGNDESVSAVSPFTNEQKVDAMHDDPDSPLRLFVPKWAVSPGYVPVTAKELLEYTPQAWKENIFKGKDEKAKLIAFGMMLKSGLSRVFGEYRITAVKKRDAESREQNAYQLVSVK